MENNQAIASAALKPGEETSEHAQTQSASFWAKLLIIIGLVADVGGAVLQALQESFSTIQNPQVGKLIMAIGTVVTIAGMVKNALVTNGYSLSRAQVKSSAVRDLELKPSISADGK